MQNASFIFDMFIFCQIIHIHYIRNNYVFLIEESQ